MRKRGEVVKGIAYRRKWLHRSAMLVCITCTACGLFSIYDRDCGNPSAIPAGYANALACAGWLTYVEENVSIIEFLDVATFESKQEHALGSAICGRCTIRVATRDRDLIDIAATIVHEAAHLEDDCENGEPPAIGKATAFRQAYQKNVCGPPGI